MPVSRTAPSGENPSPRNDFNGVLALVVDLNRLAEVYLGPAPTEFADGELMLSLSTPDFNNMLTAILGDASLIYKDAPADSPIRE